MQNFNDYESKHYDFYRFTRLVVDTLIKDHNFNIPYDLEMGVIYRAYTRFNFINNVSSYEDQVDFVLSDKQLLLDLQAVNEGY